MAGFLKWQERENAFLGIGAESEFCRLCFSACIGTGMDNAAQEQLERILKKLALEPFIVPNSEAGGKALIETLEAKLSVKQHEALC